MSSLDAQKLLCPAVVQENQAAACLDLLETKLRSYLPGLTGLWEDHAYFTQRGVLRLTAIAGYIVGVKHAGKTEVAEEMAEDFLTNMARLTRMGYEVNPAKIDFATSLQESQLLFSAEDIEPITVKVPRQKIVLHDDRCMHSFSFDMYYPLNSKIYWECFNKHAKNGSINPHQQVVTELKITEQVYDPKQVLTKSVFKNAYQYQQYYTYGYNGGLIYHGSNSGETFTVSLQSKVWWGIHT